MSSLRFLLGGSCPVVVSTISIIYLCDDGHIRPASDFQSFVSHDVHSKPLLPDDIELFYSFHEDHCPVQSVFGRAVVFATTTAPVIPKVCYTPFSAAIIL